MQGLRSATALIVLGLSIGAPASADDLWGQEIFHDTFDNVSTDCPAKITLPDGSTRSRLVHANITYGLQPGMRPNVDLTDWDNLWGYNNNFSPQVAWPGVGGAAPVIGLYPRQSYVAARFHTPTSSNLNGSFSNPSYVSGPPLTFAISRRCGDFDDYMETAGCLVRDVPTSDAVMVKWKFTANAPGSWCNLQPDTDYYVNFVFSDPASTDGCAAQQASCATGTVSYHN